MTFIPSSLQGSDRLLAWMLPSLLAATLFMAAAQSHLLCNVFCIHSGMAMADDICTSR
ncbi:hypothetical protein [Rhizobium paknamense]|uniref:Uncharacterized protein n=1 Tax=Rhizobium paknamense TaxID=1206817 RepID=A0ABU0IHZ3_9HYPH|nr:hypothetical protein [Rhizobium paknamense]MDQ0457885.1 hypothetical protein [Rhizobium paknamense]